MNPVMCITKNELSLIDGINRFEIKPEHIHFINRNIVDSKLPNYHSIGVQLPQILPYVFIKCKDEYLTYARKGTETRLHGKRSMGFGGHVELEDLQDNPYITIRKTAERELLEELNLKETVTFTNEFIYSTYDLVSQVHIGAIGFIEIKDKSLIKPNPDEVLDPQWLTTDAIRARLDSYEKWSQILIKHLDKTTE